MPALSKPKPTLPGFTAEQSASLYAELERMSQDIRRISTPDAERFISTDRVTARGNQFLRLSPRSTGQVLLLPHPANTVGGDQVVISLEDPKGPLTVVVVPATAAGTVQTPSVNGQARVVFTLPGEIRLTSNGNDRWTTGAQFGAATAAAAAAAQVDLSAEPFVTHTTPTALSNARVATSTPSIAVDLSTAGQIRWNPVTGFFTWAYVLSQGNNSGAFNPHIDTSQYLGFGNEGALPASGQIRSSASFEARATGSVTLTASTDIIGAATAEVRFNGPGGVALEACATPSTSIGAADMCINVDGGLSLNAGAQQVAVTNGNVELRATNDLLLNGIAGAALESCATPSVAVATGDVAINADGGVGIRAGITPITSVSNGVLDVSTSSNVNVLTAADLIVNARSGINLNADATATVTAVGTGVIALNAPTNGVAITAGLAEENLVGAGDVKINASSGVRLHAGATAATTASGIELSSDTSIVETPTTFWRAVPTTDAQIAAGSGINLRAGSTTALGADDGDILLNATGGIGLVASASTTLTGVTGQDIRLIADLDIGLAAASGVNIVAGSATPLAADAGDAVLQATGGLGLRAGTGTLGTLTGATDGAIEASATGPISLTPGTFVSINGESFLRFTEEAASTPALSAGDGLVWVVNSTANRLVFTDDTNTDNTLGYRSWADVLAGSPDSGTNAPNFQHRIHTTGVYTEASLGSPSHDLAIGNVCVVRLNTPGTPSLTGMVPTADGQMVHLINVHNTATVTLLHDTGSTAANRFNLPSHVSFLNYQLLPSSGVLCRYDGTLSRWTLVDAKAWPGLSVAHGVITSIAVTSVEFIEGLGLDISGTGSPSHAITIEARATSDTQQGVIEIATETEVENASDTVRAVTPGRLHRHPSAAKCWIRIGPATTTPAASYNITSATNGAGLTVVTIANDFSSANWACMVTNESAASLTGAGLSWVTSQAAGSVQVNNIDASDPQVIEDPVTAFMMVGFGDHN